MGVTSITAQQLTDENSSMINAYFNQVPQANAQMAQTLLLQQGDYNTIDIQTGQKESISVMQHGHYNGYFFISAYGDKDFNLDVVQQGNNNNIQVFGENSLMQNATILQTGSDKQIIITSN